MHWLSIIHRSDCRCSAVVLLAESQCMTGKWHHREPKVQDEPPRAKMEAEAFSSGAWRTI